MNREQLKMMNVKYQDFPNSCKGRGGDSKFLLRAGGGGGLTGGRKPAEEGF